MRQRTEGIPLVSQRLSRWWLPSGCHLGVVASATAPAHTDGALLGLGIRARYHLAIWRVDNLALVPPLGPVWKNFSVGSRRRASLGSQRDVYREAKVQMG